MDSLGWLARAAHCISPNLHRQLLTSFHHTEIGGKQDSEKVKKFKFLATNSSAASIACMRVKEILEQKQMFKLDLILEILSLLVNNDESRDTCLLSRLIDSLNIILVQFGYLHTSSKMEEQTTLLVT